MRVFVDLRAAAAAGVTIVMPARRPALALRARLARAMTAAGHAVWASPDVLPWEAWLRRLHETLTLSGMGSDIPFLLSPEQERLLWIRAIGESADSPLQRERLARLAMQARAVALGYDLDLSRAAQGAATAELEAYAQWSRRFVQQCRELGAIDRAGWLARIANGPLPPQRATLLVPHAADLAPAAQRLLARLEAAGMTRAGLAPLPAREPERSVHAHAGAECAAAVAWARARRAADPEASVVLALADPRPDRDALERALRDLSTAAPLDAEREPRPYVLEAAIPLHDVPIIRTALAWLRLGTRLRATEAGPLVTSPYLGGTRGEWLARARLDAALKSVVVEAHGAASLAAWCLGEGSACPELGARLASWRDVAGRAPRRQSLQAWMAWCEEAVALAGWPGECALTAAEEEAVKQWRQAIEATAALDAVAPACTLGEALSLLRSALTGRADLDPVTPDAIELMSLEDAAALQPEHVWVLGLHDAAWPRRPEPNPLLPFGLQRGAGVPGTRPGEDLAAATGKLAQLVAAAASAMLSAARTAGDLPLAPSALAGLAAVEAAPAHVPRPAWWGVGSARPVCESFIETTVVPPLAGERLGGGAALLSDQAACPFRAYARHRLAAAPIDEAGPGLDAAERGDLLHRVLAAFWERVGDQAALLALGTEGRRGLVARTVAAAIEAHPSRRLFGPEFWRLEQERVTALAGEWLDTELGRPPFTVVAREESFRLDLAGLPLRLRADRIDRLVSGGELLVDYKTGRVKGRSWDPPRPDEPQLPVYALARAETMRGITFAQVRKGECKFVDLPAGIAAQGESAERAQVWAGTVPIWRAELEGLAREFLAGEAAVRPKHGAATCRYCDLALFCRVHEARLREDEEAADDAS